MFFGGGIDPYWQLKELGLLERYQVADSILSAIPKDLNGVALYDPDFTWYGTAISGFGIVYNKPVLKDRPASRSPRHGKTSPTRSSSHG